MASTQEYVAFVVGQITGDWAVRYRKMFGEYMVYINDKPILLVCDNTVYVKQLDCIKDLMAAADKGCPYTGAKECYILDIEDVELVEKVIYNMEQVVPVPKPKKKKNNLL